MRRKTPFCPRVNRNERQRNAFEILFCHFQSANETSMHTHTHTHARPQRVLPRICFDGARTTAQQFKSLASRNAAHQLLEVKALDWLPRHRVPRCFVGRSSGSTSDCIVMRTIRELPRSCEGPPQDHGDVRRTY
jgi:hypothetical protein